MPPAAVLGMAAVGDIIVGEGRESTLSDVSDEPVTLVKMAGLKVHLEVKCEEQSVGEVRKGKDKYLTVGNNTY